MTHFFISIPHSGEQIPEEAHWLSGLEETLLMFDVDRYVDELYEPSIEKFKIATVKTQWHRYAVDLNRRPTDIDANIVVGAGELNTPVKYASGLHWHKTTQNHTIMPEPMEYDLHQALVEKYYNPFHQQITAQFNSFFQQGASKVFHLDAHSMPSLGTKAHPDPGEKRAEIVISDFEGQSCQPEYVNLCREAFTKAGFKVAYNWPYKGGGITQMYGRPNKGQHTLQVEINRSIYMDEKTKLKKENLFSEVSQKITQSIGSIINELPNI